MKLRCHLLVSISCSSSFASRPFEPFVGGRTGPPLANAQSVQISYIVFQILNNAKHPPPHPTQDHRRWAGHVDHPNGAQFEPVAPSCHRSGMRWRDGHHCIDACNRASVCTPEVLMAPSKYCLPSCAPPYVCIQSLLDTSCKGARATRRGWGSWCHLGSSFQGLRHGFASSSTRGKEITSCC